MARSRSKSLLSLICEFGLRNAEFRKGIPVIVDRELVMINYQDEQVHFEIFVTGPNGGNSRKIAHTCLEVDNLEVFLGKCHSLNVDIARIPKGDKTLTFIKDFDGNLFEIMGG